MIDYIGKGRLVGLLIEIEAYLVVFLILESISSLLYTLKINRKVVIVKRELLNTLKTTEYFFAFLLLFIIK